MKQLFIALATAVVLFSCKSNADTERAIESAKRATIDSMNAINTVKQQVIDSMKQVKHVRGRNNTPVVTSNNGSYEAGTPATAPAVAPAPQKKKGWKGWSHTAKGAVVGAGAGAITGAIVNPDHLKGAAIGTLIGAGAGAATGAIVDHSKKKKSRAQ